MKIRLALLFFLAVACSFINAITTLSVMSYVSSTLDSIAFTFTLSEGQFTPLGRIRLATRDSNGFVTQFVPATTGPCTLETDAETDIPYLHILAPSSPPSTSFEQICEGLFLSKSAFDINAIYDIESPLEAIFTVAPLQSLFAPESSPPTFSPIFQPSTYDSPSVGLPYTQGMINFDLVLDHEFQPLTPNSQQTSLSSVTIPRQYYVHIHNAPQLSHCTYKIKDAPILPIPNPPRLTTVALSQSSAPIDQYNFFTAVITLPHTPFFTHSVDEQYSAKNVTNINYYTPGSKQYHNGDFNATLSFSCLAQLPRLAVMTDEANKSYIMRLSSSDNANAATAKYSYLTTPISQPAITLPPPEYINNLVKLLVTPSLNDSCRIFSSSSPPTCQLHIEITLDTSEIATDGPKTLQVNVSDELHLALQPNYFLSITGCSDAEPTLLPDSNTIKFSFTRSFIIDVSEGSEDTKFSMDCTAVGINGIHPSMAPTADSHEPGSASLGSLKTLPDASQIRVVYAVTSTTLLHNLVPPEEQQTLAVSVTSVRSTYTIGQNSFTVDSPYIAQAILSWMRDTLKSQLSDVSSLQITNLEFSFQPETGSSRLGVTVAFLGTLTNIQRFLPIFNSPTAGVDTTASSTIKSRLEQLYVDNAAQVTVNATASFFPISARNGLLDYTETDIDCGGRAANPKAPYGPRCRSGSQCLSDADCEFYCSSTIDFWEPLVRTDAPKKAVQIVRKTIYQGGICHNSALSMQVFPILTLIFFFLSIM